MNWLFVGALIFWLLSIPIFYKIGYVLGYSQGEVIALEKELERRRK